MEYARTLVEDLVDAVNIPIGGKLIHFSKPLSDVNFQSVVRITGPNNSVSQRNIGRIQVDPDIQWIDINFTRRRSATHVSANAIRGSIYFSLDLDEISDVVLDSMIHISESKDDDHLKMEIDNLWNHVFSVLNSEYVHGRKSRVTFISFKRISPNNEGHEPYMFEGHVHAFMLR